MPRPPYAGFAAQATAAITGTASDGLTEAEIVAGGETIIITLTADTWVASGATFNAQRQNIIDGLDSDGVEATGWNNEVRDNLAVDTVVRTSDTVVTITLSAQAAYDVTNDETITVTIPASALVTSGDAITATPTFDVTADVVVESEEVYSGGWAHLNDFDAELQRRRRRERERKKLLEEIEQIKESTDQEIAFLIAEGDRKEAEKGERERLKQLTEKYTSEQIEKVFGERVSKAYRRAAEKATYSALEALVREAKRAEEEEDFLMIVLMTETIH